MDIYKIMANIAKILFLIISAIVIIQLILMLTGNSPTEIQILLGLMVGIIIFLFGFIYQVAKFKGKAEEFIDTSKKTFQKIGYDFKKVDQRFTKIDKELNLIKLDVREIKNKI